MIFDISEARCSTRVPSAGRRIWGALEAAQDDAAGDVPLRKWRTRQAALRQRRPMAARGRQRLERRGPDGPTGAKCS